MSGSSSRVNGVVTGGTQFDSHVPSLAHSKTASEQLATAAAILDLLTSVINPAAVQWVLFWKANFLHLFLLISVNCWWTPVAHGDGGLFTAGIAMYSSEASVLFLRSRLNLNYKTFIYVKQVLMDIQTFTKGVKINSSDIHAACRPRRLGVHVIACEHCNNNRRPPSRNIVKAAQSHRK